MNRIERQIRFSALPLLVTVSGLAQPAPPFTTEAERCIGPAAHYHSVNPYVLRSILRVESGLNPNAMHRNEDGSYDVGIGQHNSKNLQALARFGIGPRDLQDACVGTFVAAWHLGKQVTAFGNTWFAIGAYHSRSPYENDRYRRLINNELVSSGFMRGQILQVPPPYPKKASQQEAHKSREPRAASSMVIFDSQSR